MCVCVCNFPVKCEINEKKEENKNRMNVTSNKNYCQWRKGVEYIIRVIDFNVSMVFK